MPSRYAQWMYDWETRLTSVDNNRVVRPLEWGLDWTHTWPGCNGGLSSQASRDLLEYFSRFNERIIRDSDNFYSYRKPTDFRLERREVQVFSTREVPDPRLEEKVRGTHAEFLRFTSPVATPFPENNLVNARWFPARGFRSRESCGAHGRPASPIRSRGRRPAHAAVDCRGTLRAIRQPAEEAGSTTGQAPW